MVSFRKSLLALTGLALFTGLASAQSTGPVLQCVAVASGTPLLRAESITDLIGDITLSCTGGTPTAIGSVVPTANITVALQTNLTSRILSNGGSEALLLMNEAGTTASGLPQTVCTNTGNNAYNFGATPGGCGPAYSSTFTNSSNVTVPVACATNASPCPAGLVINTFQAVSTATNQVTFLGVPVLAPVSAGTATIYRITNIRANASALSTGAFPGTTPVLASVSVSGSTALPISNPVQTTGFVQSGLSTQLRTASNGTPGTISSLTFLQCQSVPSSGTSPVAGTTLRYTEGFASAFKTRVAATATTTGFTVPPVPNQNVPATIYNSESGLLVGIGAGGPTAGLADFGTRLRAVFNNIPAGVNIFVTTTNYSASNTNTFTNNTAAPGTVPVGPGSTNSIAVLVASETAPDFGNSVPVVNFTNTANGGNITLAPVTPLGNGSFEAVWEVVSSNPNAVENFDFGVFYQFTSNTAATGGGTPAIGTGTVTMSFAPVSTSMGPSGSAPIPRFAATGSPNNIVTISICQTALLFPFVTNENGFETGISIANTTSDPFGTAAQSGTCTLTFYGDNAVGPTSPVAPCTTAGACVGPVASGKVFANTLSSILGGSAFQGYMFAVCNFQEAHGFAFISDAHATNLAMGYLALVVGPPSTPRGPGGEALEN